MENKSKLLKTLTNVTNFDKYLTFPTNRPKDINHIKELKDSFLQFGTGGSMVRILKSKAFGKIQYFVVDGQHTIDALKNAKMGGNVIIMQLEEDTILNVTLFISKLNNTNKGWTTDNYVDGFSIPQLKMKEYQLFKELKKETKLTITDLLYIYTGSGVMKDYKSGNLSFKNQKDSDVLLKCVIKLKPHLPNKAYVRRSLYKMMAIVGDYKKMTDAIITHAKTLKEVGREFKENEADFFIELEAIRRKAFKQEMELA